MVAITLRSALAQGFADSMREPCECGSLLVGMKQKSNWAKIAVAIFTMAVFYASVCSTACATGVCPNQVQQTSGHDCEQTPSHHSHHPGHQTPDNSDCSLHQHPNLFLGKSGNLSQSQVSIASHFNIFATAVNSGLDLIRSTHSAKATDLAPPLTAIGPLYQKISVLRI